MEAVPDRQCIDGEHTDHGKEQPGRGIRSERRTEEFDDHRSEERYPSSDE